MLNVHELERKWFRYQIKKWAPILLAIASVFIISLLSVLWPKDDIKVAIDDHPSVTINKKKDLNSTPVTPTPPIIVKTETKSLEHEVTTKITPKIVEKSNKKQGEKLVLKPSLNFMYDIEEDMVNDSIDTAHSVENKNPSSDEEHEEEQQSNTVHQETLSVNNTAVEPNSIIQTKPQNMRIKKETGDDELQDIISRFKKNKNPALSLFIARKYYSMGDYEKSYNYALTTNQLNNEIEESWLIFTRSLVKLNQKNMAISTLNKYISQTNSIKASSLLQEINSGSFK